MEVITLDYIIRSKYINKIEKFVDKPIIKVITGMRRVGKSTILTIIHDEILKDVPVDNKIYINFESLEFFNVCTSSALAKYLKDIINRTEGKLYFFFDEIQIVENWEKIVNGLRVDLNCDIYITGSNSNLISGDLATLLAGRYIEFEIQPFTFDEFIEINKEISTDKDELFYKYIKIGGMPFLKYFHFDESVCYKYLDDVHNTVLVKDVLNYNKIRDVDLFNRILSYVMQNIGTTFSANSLKRYLKNEDRNISVDTILNYLEYCSRAFIIKKVPRYDSLGKKILKVDEKYYLTDHGFRQASGYSNTKDIEKVLENIVYIELISRGYNVKIGRINNREIDFIAQKDDEISYFQVCYLMESESTREREFGVYKLIQDNYPKYVISMDKIDFSQDGVKHLNIVDFLLNYFI